MRVVPPSTLFGLPRVLERDSAEALEVFLLKSWSGQQGLVPAGLENDLERMKALFSPTVTGRRLRDAVRTLPTIAAQQPSVVTDEIFLESSDGRGLVTPEGRIVLQLLQDHSKQKEVIFTIEEVAWAYEVAADLYRNWGRDRILEALGLTESRLRLPVIAFCITLLVNGTFGQEKALVIPDDERREQQLSDIIGPIIDSFVTPLETTRRRSESFRLRGGWILSETRRHLFRYISYTDDSIWVRQSRATALIDRLSRDLARNPKRVRREVERAIDGLVEEYNRARPALASRGLAHERSSNTRTVRQELLAHFEETSVGRD